IQVRLKKSCGGEIGLGVQRLSNFFTRIGQSAFVVKDFSKRDSGRQVFAIEVQRLGVMKQRLIHQTLSHGDISEEEMGLGKRAVDYLRLRERGLGGIILPGQKLQLAE